MGTVSIKQLHCIQRNFISTDFVKPTDFVKSDMHESSKELHDVNCVAEEAKAHIWHPSGVQEITKTEL